MGTVPGAGTAITAAERVGLVPASHDLPGFGEVAAGGESSVQNHDAHPVAKASGPLEQPPGVAHPNILGAAPAHVGPLESIGAVGHVGGRRGGGFAGASCCNSPRGEHKVGGDGHFFLVGLGQRHCQQLGRRRARGAKAALQVGQALVEALQDGLHLGCRGVELHLVGFGGIACFGLRDDAPPPTGQEVVELGFIVGADHQLAQHEVHGNTALADHAGQGAGGSIGAGQAGLGWGEAAIHRDLQGSAGLDRTTGSQQK